MISEKDISTKSKILEQLIYAEVFKHPLTAGELYFFSSESEGLDMFRALLSDLQRAELIVGEGDHFTVFEIGDKIQKRLVGGDRADKYREKAFKIAKFINRFPFVEGVGISGSLSKGILYDDGDFDFFIITKTGRVWLARTLLVLYKKIFLFNSRKFFCVNYFIDTDHLEIEEHNRFTAVEVFTLIPVSGSIFKEFYHFNKWVEGYFPKMNNNKEISPDSRKPVLSKLIMWVFKGNLGDKVDAWFLRLTLKRWKKKFGHFDPSKFELTMRSRPYVSKHHPSDFQNKVLSEFELLKSKYKVQFQTQLDKNEIDL